MARKKEHTVPDGGVQQNAKSSMETELQNKLELHRTNSNALKPKEVSSYAGTSSRNVYDVADLRAQLSPFGLTVRDIPGDGNCLFRALGDQLDGHTGNHLKHRLDTVRYMIAHRKHFEPFIDVPFDRYVSDMRRTGTYAGQDALVAFARLHKVNIIIHQVKRPLWKIEGTDDTTAPELHLSYHNGEHYSSVRRFGDIAKTPASIRIMTPTTNPYCDTHSVHSSTSPVTAHTGSNINKTFPKLRNEVNLLHETDCIESTLPEIIHSDDFSKLVKEVMNRTGCGDTSLVTEALIDNAGDLNQTVDYLLSIALFFEPVNSETKTVSRDNICGSETIECRLLNVSRSSDENIRSSYTFGARVARSQLIDSSSDEEKRRAKLGDTIQEKTQNNSDNDLRFLTL